MTSQSTFKTAGILMEPLDTLFFRDGRPFDSASRTESILPLPQVAAGALRTWLLRSFECDFGRLAERMREGQCFSEAVVQVLPDGAGLGEFSVRGPWFHRHNAPLTPIPSVLMREEGGMVTQSAPLKSRALPGWNPPEKGMLPLWIRDSAQAKRITGYLSPTGLGTFLCGRIPRPEDIVAPADLFAHDARTGIAVCPDKQAAAEGMIYGIRLLALKEGVRLYMEVEGPADIVDRLPQESTPLPLGGEGRRVLFQRTAPYCWPEATSADGDGVLLLLTAPGIFDGGWRPSSLKAVAASVPGYTAVSGWDLALGGPKPTRFGVQAGSVYFVSPEATLPARSLCEGEDRLLGWGSYLKGVFRYV